MHDDFHPPVSHPAPRRPWPIVIGAVVIVGQLAALGWVVQGQVQVQHAAERQSSWVARGLQASPAMTYAAADAPAFGEQQP
ncbi:hypothetical protein AVHM3334_00755 [Acidovorax sp. SUPP3334]|nr:hypothetical protein AVHM3334_00755 [Acidovorax sp. SUPP3334]